jgi:hypothetical protein
MAMTRREVIAALMAAPVVIGLPNGWSGDKGEALYQSLPHVVARDTEVLLERRRMLTNLTQIFRFDYGVSRTKMAMAGHSGVIGINVIGINDVRKEKQLAFDYLIADVNKSLSVGRRLHHDMLDQPGSRFLGGLSWMQGLGLVQMDLSPLAVHVLRPVEHFDTTPTDYDGFQGSWIAELTLGFVEEVL